MAGKTDIQKGDKVVVQCPKYSFESHKARVIGEPVQTDTGRWFAPIRYNCMGINHANASCHGMLKVNKGFQMKLSRAAITTGIVLLFVLLIGGWFVGNYNSLVTAKNAVDNSKSKIDTQLTRRYEIIDNIVASVKGSQAQESDVFGKIAEARKIGGASGASTETQAQANSTIDTQIALLPRLQEAYPELRSNDQVSKLIAELQGSANSVRESRDFYNDTVTNYNNNITKFPKSIFAGIFGYDKAKLFEASAEQRTNPTVNFDKKETN